MRQIRGLKQPVFLLSTLVCIGLMSAAPTLGAQRQSAAVSNAPTSDRLAAGKTLARTIDITLDRVSLETAIRAIGAHAGTMIVYRNDEIAKYPALVTLHAARMPLREALEQILRATNLTVIATRDGNLTVTERNGGGSVVASGTLRGTVTDAQTKRPLRGVKIGLDGVDRVTESTDDGTYQVQNLAGGPHTLTMKLLGYAKVVRTVTVQDDAIAVVDVALQSSATALEQVVVTGTIIPTELKAVPNAITVITAKQIEQRGIAKITELFRGDVPGLFAQNPGSSAALDEVMMFSRGATALSSTSAGTNNGTNPIKTYIDGVELADPKYLSQIDPKSIERIEILTGPQASTIYGSNAINGVMQIFTKRGTSNTPQLTLSLLSGWVENNFSSARTPQQDYNGQLSGLDGRVSYNAGGSWNYIGAWTPSKQTARVGGIGGMRIELPTSLGLVTSDFTLQRTSTINRRHGSQSEVVTKYLEAGYYIVSGTAGLQVPQTDMFSGQTLGLTLSYTAAPWWSQELGAGQDVSDTESRWTARGYQYLSDTTLALFQNHSDRRSLRYTTTVRIPVTTFVQGTVTVGGDAWKRVQTGLSMATQTLTGSWGGSANVSRQPGHNTGGFMQTQVGIRDQLFLTYGLRAEWNPTFGRVAEPNYAPRYGVALTTDIGVVTAKVRASYGHSTRPPAATQKLAVAALPPPYNPTDVYGPYNKNIANPDLGPEYQKGGEGGIELYLGGHASLIATRYNQTVDALITSVPGADSVRSLLPNPVFYNGNSCAWWSAIATWCSSQDAQGYTYALVGQNINAASIRNQGWELQSSVVTGPITSRGTYSWTKSRVIGVTPKYRRFFDPINYPEYQPGVPFQYLPEHTWALEITYVRPQTTIALNVTGTGQLTNVRDALFQQSISQSIRLLQNRLRMIETGGYVNFNSPYALADVTAAHRFSGRIESVLQVQNLTDHYTNDYFAIFPTIGRQTKAGLRIRL